MLPYFNKIERHWQRWTHKAQDEDKQTQNKNKDETQHNTEN